MRKNKKKRKKIPLLQSIFIPLLAVTILHAVIFYGAIAVTDTINGFNANSESQLNQSAVQCATYLETEMNSKWNNISGLSTAASKHIDEIITGYHINAKHFLNSEKYTSDFLLDISDDMLASLRINSANGIFIVLANDDSKPDRNSDGSFKGIYFSDNDSQDTPSDYSDIVMVRGPSYVAEEYSIPLDISWMNKYKYVAADKNMEYFFKPMAAAYTYPLNNAENLGYWSRPFYFSSGNYYESELIVTYSEPIVYKGTVLGTVGIAVSLDKVIGIFPDNETVLNGSGCFSLMSCGETSQAAAVTAVSDTDNGFEYYNGKSVILASSNDSKLKKIKDVQVNDSPACCAIAELDIYSKDSPYISEKWSIAAVAGQNDIYADSYAVRTRLLCALFISVSIGIVVVYFTARHTLKPIKALAENVKKGGGDSYVDVIDTNISEISDLSVMISGISRKRTKYLNELITERERYLLALQSINDNILEYDCINDIFYMHYFRPAQNNGKIITKEYPNFRSLVTTGQICHMNFIPAMLDFTNGLTDENGVYFKIKSPKSDDSYIWTFAKSKSVFDSEGNLIRVIASARDVTEEKTREQEQLEKERFDPVTKFYKSEYGEMLLSRFALESNEKSVISAIVRIADMDNLLNMYGQTCCAAILEEAAIVIRRIVPEDYLVYRGGMDEFVIVTTLSSRDEARAMLRKIIDGISNIYSGGNIKIESVAGAYIKHADEPADAVKLKIRFASEAAYRFRDEFGGIVFADEVSNRAEFMSEFKMNGPHRFSPFGDVKMEEHSDIISFAFNIFEKTSDIAAAMEVLLSKAGRMLNMDRILIFDMNRDYCTIRLSQQWNSPEMAPIDIKTYISGKTAYDDVEKRFSGIKYKITDTAIFDRDANPDFGKVISDGTPFSVPMTDNDVVTGIIVYECSSKTGDEQLIHCLTELTKIISAYISKSKTTRESRAKSEFLSKMSHEIRTPMNAIIGMTSIAMSSEDVSPSTMECLKKISSSSNYLLSLINDILDMSRIESGKMTTEETYLNLDDLISQIDTMIRVQTDNKGIWLRVEKHVEHVYLLGDPLKLNQVLVNIMGNAVKFTSKGGIHLRVSEIPAETEDTVNIFFSIKDTGIGIGEENIGKIFNSFEQADNTTVRKYGGTGLGLAISSNLVQLLGGKLEVRSKLGEGSEFFFTIPMKITEPVVSEDIGNADSIDFTSKRVLIVEDDELNIEIARTLIETEGIMTDVAENGAAAVDKFEKSEIGYYDAILMDIRMPVMDGIEATKHIRSADRADASSVPIIAMSANAFDEDMKKSVECGMNGHLTKPIDMTKVMETFRRIWSAKQ